MRNYVGLLITYQQSIDLIVNVPRENILRDAIETLEFLQRNSYLL